MRSRFCWGYSASNDGEWNMASPDLEETIKEARTAMAEMGLNKSQEIIIARGKLATKAECEEWGNEWPFYEIDMGTAMAIRFDVAEGKI